MSIYKASIFNYLFNSINSVIVIINGIVMVPIYFHYMSVSTYGAWLATGNVVAMLGLLESGFASVITQKLSTAIAQKDEEKFRKLAGANILTAIFLAVVIFVLGISISPFITDWINVTGDIASDIRVSYIIALASSCIGLMVSLFGAFPQVWQDTKNVGMINTFVNIISIVSLIVALLCGCEVMSIAISYLVRSLLNLTLQGSWIIRNWKKKNIATPIIEVQESVLLAKQCAYPFLSKLSGVLMNNTQSFILAHFMNPVLAVIYDLTAKICYVACSFVSMTNGSFFALFSLTMASKDQKKIESVLTTTTNFFLISLAIVGLYSICFTEPIARYWVGLDKFGGTWLLVVIVVAKLIYQMKGYCNNILYSGGLINTSAKLDIMCMSLYVLLLLAIIKTMQEYAIPLATIGSSLFFIGWYVRLMAVKLSLNVSILLKETTKAIILIIPFVVAHYMLNIDYNNLKLYAVYFIIFSWAFVTVLYMTNRDFFIPIIAKIRKK